MQNDIVPPQKGLNTKTDKKPPAQDHPKTSAKPAKKEPFSILLNNDGPKSSKKVPRWKFWHDWSGRQQFIALVIFFILLISTLMLVFGMGRDKPQQAAVQNPNPVEQPKTVASPLTGLQVAPDQAKRPVTGVMIENSLDARPQSGLYDAGVVYEAIAEGGITRFLALFQEARPGYVGPVRSLRPYYIDFAAPYQASVAHVGGSPEALKQIRRGNTGARDIDQFFNAGAYWRVSSRYAPHNMYTNFKNLDALNKSKGYKHSEFSPWARKDEEPAATPTAKTIDVKISSDLYYSHYDYDKSTNSYSRSEGGRPHYSTSRENDSKGKRIKPKVVIVLVMSYNIVDSSGHSDYDTTGKGRMYLFQDGKLTKGYWRKSDRKNMFKFTDSNGKILPLNAGQTWVTIIKSPGELVYKP